MALSRINTKQIPYQAAVRRHGRGCETRTVEGNCGATAGAEATLRFHAHDAILDAVAQGTIGYALQQQYPSDRLALKAQDRCRPTFEAIAALNGHLHLDSDRTEHGIGWTRANKSCESEPAVSVL